MRVARGVRVALLVGLLGFPSFVFPLLLDAQENDALVRRVDDHYNHLSSLRAHYTEHYSGMGMDRTEEGTLLLKKLDDLRSPLRFLLGHTQLRKELENLTVAPDGPGYRISGVPKGMEQRVKLLSL